MVRPMLRILPMGFLFLFLALFIANSAQALIIPQVPDTQQPVTGSIGNPINNACAPVSAVNITQYWDVTMNHPNAFHVNATLIPNTAADYLYYFMDTNNWGSPVRMNGTVYPAASGTYSADIMPGFFEFVRWDALNLFTTPPPALPASKLGYTWTYSSDYALGFDFHVASIDSGRPDVICFRFWNPVNPSVILPDPGGTGEMIQFYTWGPQVPGSSNPNHIEQWNLNYGQECIGHAVTGVGYLRNFDPDGGGPLPNTDWFICHDNWLNTAVNVALPWANWAATIYADPGTPEEPPEITYWKPDTTYALTGMPDFPSQLPCHSGPTAVTNCLWWYGAMDYYPFINPKDLKDELFTYFASDTVFDPWGGTDVHQMEAGLDAFFNEVYPPWPFVETTFPRPDFRVMAESLMKCQDVILLIGNWWLGDDGTWWRDGGRYVTMAGVDTATLSIALSDPETDNAEAGGYGRVRPPHAIHSPTDATHWNPMTLGGYDYPVSHDAYNVYLDSPSPGGSWWISGFPRGFSPSHANCPTEFMNQTAPNPDPAIYPYHAEVEYAVMICPKRQEPIDTCNYYKAPYLDYAQNGMPDFDQKQGNWWNQQSGNFSWCGPVALANCLWWFDSKFEPNPLDPRPFYPGPGNPPANDFYPLIPPFGPWDDHDINNVVPFINMLGPICNVDGPDPGTSLPDLQAGFHNWLIQAGLPNAYTSYVVLGPEYPEIRDSVIASQDVILLLGFYEMFSEQVCQRLGGHYVTCAGACVQEPAICISDPFFDKNEGEPPPGTAHGSTVHNDAFFVSGPHGSINHDRFQMAPVAGGAFPCGPATWILTNYPNRWTQDGLFTFANENPLAPGLPHNVYQGGQIVVAIDAAIIICPAAIPIPDIDVLPESLYYQQTSYSTVTYSNQIVICNNGTAPLSITSITSDYSWITAGAFVSPLAGGQCDTVDVIINTNGIAPNFYIGRFHVNSNDPDEATVDKPLYILRVIEPDISVTPDSIFHSQQTNTSNNYTMDFTIMNTGSAVLTYNAISALPWVSLIGITGSIWPGGSDAIDVFVNTNGIVPGTYLDVITINSDDPDTPVLNKPKIVIEVTAPPLDTCSFYKAPYVDYAPNGMPDFDQKQGNWWNQQTGNFSWCGPAALANCIWWFDSKFEPNPIEPRPFQPDPTSPPPNNNYPLLNPFGPWDDHDINNVVPFINLLGPICNVDGPNPGTSLPDLETGFHNWLIQAGLPNAYSSFIVMGPGYPQIRDSVLASQDVILLLGFYEVLPGQQCQRVGGHYVTCAGACPQDPYICISDPFFDKNEGEPPPGTAHGATVHNDAFFVSGPHGSINHDRYEMVSGGQIPCGPATWFLPRYPNLWTQDGIFTFANENPYIPGQQPVVYQGGPIAVGVDAALIICPIQEQHVPDINVIPDSLYHSQLTDTSTVYNNDFAVYNNGTAILNYGMSNTLSWVVLSVTPGSIPPGGNDQISITVNTNGITPGIYLDSVTITSNDPDTPVLRKPKIVINVTRPQGCSYVIGDANDSDNFNGLDVSYSVSYFKGGPPPPYSCPCPPHGTFYVAGDVNQSCSYNGLDVTYMVAYFKGGPPPRACSDCLPIAEILGKPSDKNMESAH